MGLLMFLFFGFVIGLLARAVMPGEQRMGIAMTALLGGAGSLLGGFAGSVFGGHSLEHVRALGFVGGLCGALALLFLAGHAFTRRAVT